MWFMKAFWNGLSFCVKYYLSWYCFTDYAYKLFVTQLIIDHCS